jgi:hypothetical protein
MAPKPQDGEGSEGGAQMSSRLRLRGVERKVAEGVRLGDGGGTFALPVTAEGPWLGWPLDCGRPLPRRRGRV